MKVCWKGFFAKNHSWSITAQSICREFTKSGHSVDIYSTNGLSLIPEDVRKNVIGWQEENSTIINGQELSNGYDLSMSYTAPKNWGAYLKHSSKNRFGIWCWEFAGKNSLPQGFAKHHQYVDWILPPSDYAKQIFIDSGVPGNKLKTIPHGINIYQISNAKPLQINSDKIKLVVNIGQPHLRKGIRETLDAYGKAFDKKSNVIFIIKVADKQPTQSFEISFNNELKHFYSKYPNHAEIKIIKEFIPNIYELYKGCDVYFHLTKAEGFGMPYLESLASGLLVMAPNHGGQKDFLSKENAILIDGKETPANPQALYWEQHNRGMWFSPNIDDAVDKLRYVVSNIDKLKLELKVDQKEMNEKYSWRSVVDRIESLIR